MMLITSFGASIGGMATPVGTPPNLIGIGLIERITGTHIGFFRWMAIGVPLVLILFAFLAAFFAWTEHARACRSARPAPRDRARGTRDGSGRCRSGAAQRLLAFGVDGAAVDASRASSRIAGLGDAPIARAYMTSVPEGVAAMLGAILLFVLPVRWAARTFTHHLGRGRRASTGASSCSTAEDWRWATSRSRPGWRRRWARGSPSWLPGAGPMLLTTVFTGVAHPPVGDDVEHGVGQHGRAGGHRRGDGVRRVDPMLPALGATLGASMGFMMPISTAPNAIVYSSGHVPISAMMRYGIVLDIAGFVTIVGLLGLLGPLLF